LNSGNACFYPADDSAKTVFLFGDSVGMSLANSLLDYGKDNNYSVITMGLAGCSYLDQQIISKYRNSKLLEKLNVRAGNSKITCSEFNQRTIDLVRTKKPDLVISSTHSIDSEAIEYFGMSYNDLLDIKVQSLAKLREVAPNLIVVGAPPLLGPEEFTPRPTVFQLHVGRKVIPLIDLERYYLQDDSGMQSKLNNLKIPYLSLLKNFCDNSKCDLFSGGDWIYADGSHLSIHGASKVKFSEILATVTR
jgi:hypothetical protein